MVKSEASIDMLLIPLFIPDLGVTQAGKVNAYNSKVEKRIDDLWRRYGFVVKIGEKEPNEPKDITTLVSLNPEKAIEGLDLLRRECAKYPVAVVRDFFIKTYRLVDSLEWTDKHRRVSGLAYDNGLVYVVFDSTNLKRTRITIHHEYLHCLDFVFSRVDPLIINEREWDGLNPQGAGSYIGERYWSMTDEEIKALNSIGFVSAYGRVNRREDRAVTGGLLIGDPKELFALAHKDYGIDQKAGKLRDELWVVSQGLIGREYFDDLVSGRVREGYWDKREGRYYRRVK